MALLPAQLANARRLLNSTLSELVTVYRAGVALALTMPDGSALRCSVVQDTKEAKITPSDPLLTQRRWQITFPDATDVRVGDEIHVLGGIYRAVEVVNPQSYSTSLDVYGYMLSDATGAVVYLGANGHISTQRDGTSGNVLDTVVANIGEVHYAFHPEGPEVSQKILILPGQDVLPDDYLTVVDRVNQPTAPVTKGKITYVDYLTHASGQAVIVLVIAGGTLPA